MTQQEVYNILKKENRWMSAYEIAKELKISQTSVRKNLHSLGYGKFIKMKIMKSKKNKDACHYKLK